MGRVMAEDAFEAVVGAHHAEIRRYLLRITARGSDADDLSQETFLRAFRAYRRPAAGLECACVAFTIATNLGATTSGPGGAAGPMRRPRWR